MIGRIAIVGTGLIGASIGLALREAGFAGDLFGIDAQEMQRDTALQLGAVGQVARSEADEARMVAEADVVVLAVPVLAILDRMQKLATVLQPHQLLTDTGSTKLKIADAARALFNQPGTARCLPGHPMAGKESGGASLAEAALFRGAMWLFTPVAEAAGRAAADLTPDAGMQLQPGLEPGQEPGRESDLELEWRGWVARFGCRTMDLDAARHDQVCAWVSHLPQMVATAMAAMFEHEFSETPELAEEFGAIGGRALREMTRLGASPYSMWRDVALTNTPPLAATLFAFEQRLAHLRENLKTPELRDEFKLANAFRGRWQV